MSHTQVPSPSGRDPRQGAEAPRETGPERFQREMAAERRRVAAAERGSPLRAVVAGLVLAVILVGVPFALLTFTGPPPVPTSLPSFADLADAIDMEALVGVLVWIVWLAWLQFAVCVVIELISAIRGVGLPSRVPLSGGSQRFARVLVGTVLLAATAVGQANAVSAPTVTGPEVATTAEAMVENTEQVREDAAEAAAAAEAEERAAAEAAEAAAAEQAEQGEVTYRLGDMELSEEEGKQLVGKKVYVVQPPEGRYHDNLWDIAERTLDDGRRYSEIYTLNAHREQPDGHELSLARLIYPNWLLIMPADAEGVDTVEAVRASTPAPATTPEPSTPPAPVDSGTPAGESGADTAGNSVADGEAGEVAGGAAAGAGAVSAPAVLPEDLLGVGLLAAGLLAAIDALRRRRRTLEPDDDALDAEVALRIGADADRVRLLDGALRTLARSQRDAEATLPGVYAAVVGDTEVELRLAPPRDDAPAPWRVTDGGAVWVLDRSALPAEVPSAPAPFPGLVSLGRDHADRDVLIDLEAAGGPVEIIGDPGRSVEVATALAAELASNGWSDRLQVNTYALPDGLDALDRLQSTRDLATTVPEISRRLAQRGAQDVLTGRIRGAAADYAPEYLVLGATPEAGVLDELLAMTGGNRRSPLGVVAAGSVPGARWSLRVDSAGGLELSELGLSVRANRLTHRSVEAVATLVAGDGPGPDGPSGGTEARPEVPHVGRSVQAAEAAEAPVLVQVFGAGRVRAPGPMEPNRVALCTEIVVYLALEAEPVHPTVLAAAIWPGGVTAAVRDSSIERTRAWLGQRPDGTARVRQDAEGRLSLTDDVVVDLRVVTSLLAQARTSRTRTAEADALRQALRLAHAPLLDGRERGRYSWISRVRVERALADALVDAAHRLAQLADDDGDPGGAVAAARAGIAVRPGEQELWRDLVRATFRLEGAAGVRGVVAEMVPTLRAVGVTGVDASTVALVEELLPGQSAELLQDEIRTA